MSSRSTPEPPKFLNVVPQFTVPDVVETAKYYCDVLGFENQGFFLDPPVFVMLRRGPVEFYFNESPIVPGAIRIRSAIGYDAYVHVAGVDALATELRSRGATIVEGPVDRVYGMRELVIEDCHGLRIAFGEDPGANRT